MIAVTGDAIIDDWKIVKPNKDKLRPTFDVVRHFATPGGAANVFDNIFNIMKWSFIEPGKRPRSDAEIDTLVRSFYPFIEKNKGIKDFYFRSNDQYTNNPVVTDLPNAVKYRVVDKDTGKILYYVSDDGPAKHSKWDDLADCCFHNLVESIEYGEISFVVVADYDKGFFNVARRNQLTKLCLENGIPILVDTKPSFYDDYRGAFCVKPNYSEYRQLDLDYMSCIRCAASIENVLSFVKDTYSFDNVINTRGGKCIVAVNAEDLVNYVEVEELIDCRECSYVGAGDSFMAMLVSCIKFGYDFEEALRRASRYATEYCRTGPEKFSIL